MLSGNGRRKQKTLEEVITFVAQSHHLIFRFYTFGYDVQRGVPGPAAGWAGW